MRYLVRRRLLQGALLAILGGIVLAGAEIAVRRRPQWMLPQWQIRYHVNRMKDAVVPDAELGYLARPHQHVEIHTQDFTYFRDTDRFGFPNPEPWPTQVKLVFLGDSLVIGEGVGLQGIFTRHIASLLPEQPLVNLGLGGAGEERQYLIYRRFGHPLQPRLVVTCLYLASDFENDLHFLSWQRQPRPTDYNTYRLGFRRAQDQRGPWHPARLFERSWLLGMGKELGWRWLHPADVPYDRYRFPDGTEILLEQRNRTFATEAIQEPDSRIDNLLTSLTKLHELVTQQHASFLVMLIPSKEELFGAHLRDGARNATVMTLQRLRAANLPVLDLYPILRQGGHTHSPYFSRDIHLNAYGNQLVAEAFVSWFREHVGGS